MSEALAETPEYEIHFLDVGDADCIAVKYRANAESKTYIVLIDAGNVSDGGAIKEFLKNRFGTLSIDLAVCTHPDKDHKGGFFSLLEDADVTIREFWLKDPYKFISDEDFTRMKRTDKKLEACRSIYNHPSDLSKNLISLIERKRNKDGSDCVWKDVSENHKHPYVPIKVLGPTEDYYEEVAFGIVSSFAELKEDPSTDAYDEKFDVSDDYAKSVIDKTDDASYTNKGSLILLLTLTPHFKILLAGDASQTSIGMAYDRHEEILGSVLKVPHHGSKHNLNTLVIDKLKPSASIVCAAQTKKHPNPAIVSWLSKYGSVYCTRKSKGLYYTDRAVTHKAEPLRKKQGS